MDIFKGLFEHYGWFWWSIIILGVIWFFNGGPAHETAHEGQYLKPPAPLDSGDVYGSYYAGTPTSKKESLDLPEAPATIIRETESTVKSFLALSKEAETIHANSLLVNKISFDGVAAARASDPAGEYIRIVASALAKAPIDISGLTIHGNAYNTDVVVPKAASLFMNGVPPLKTDVILPPGARALVSSGNSPIGTSFRTNICSGYLEETYDFTPDLRKYCPDPVAELKAAGLGNDASCLSIVREIPVCRTFQGKLPSNISSSCRTFLAERLGYNGCVLAHEHDSDFYDNEWRLFLNQDRQLWRNDTEIIKLIDAKGGVIDAITF